MEKIEATGQGMVGVTERHVEFKALSGGLDISNPSEEQKEQVKAFISEDPMYANYIMDQISTEALLKGGAHVLGTMAIAAMKFGITKEQMVGRLSGELSGYWDEMEKISEQSQSS